MMAQDQALRDLSGNENIADTVVHQNDSVH
jgi:hypothetical protein